MNDKQRLLDNNVLPVTAFVVSAADYLPQIAALKGVSEIFEKDSTGQRTDILQAITYHCVNTENFRNFSIKVLDAKRIITAAQLEEASEVVYVEIPVKDCILKPYEISYNKCKVSIIAPYIKLHKE